MEKKKKEKEKEQVNYKINWPYIKYMIVFFLGLLLIRQFLVYNNLFNSFSQL